MGLTGVELVLRVLGLAASFLYFFVAYVLSRRAVQGPAKGAQAGFILWWAGLAVIGLSTAYFAFVRSIGSFGLVGGRIILYGLVAFILIMLSGLAYYLLYLYTGSPRSLAYVIAFYTSIMVLFVAITETQVPMIEGSGAQAEWAYERPLPPDSPWSVLLGVGLVGPPLAAALAYMALYGRTHDRTIRYRIAMVSVGFVLWFGFSILNTVARAALELVETPLVAQLASQLLGVLAAVLVLLAYVPPRFVQRYGVHSVFHHAVVLPPTGPRLAPQS